MSSGTIESVALLNRQVAADFYPLAPVFEGAATGDPEYFWLYGMVFSTFVPTMVHLAAASFSLISAIPTGWRSVLWALYSAPGDDWLRRASGCVGIGFLGAVAAVLPFAATQRKSASLAEPVSERLRKSARRNLSMWLTASR